ncbi:hypothetical protein BHE74_00034180 [Ensete ventricosum]|nr:hypothetical protein BHE74_00034180 [Ensete ventricosum]
MGMGVAMETGPFDFGCGNHEDEDASTKMSYASPPPPPASVLAPLWLILPYFEISFNLRKDCSFSIRERRPSSSRITTMIVDGAVLLSSDPTLDRDFVTIVFFECEHRRQIVALRPSPFSMSSPPSAPHPPRHQRLRGLNHFPPHRRLRRTLLQDWYICLHLLPWLLYRVAHPLPRGLHGGLPVQPLHRRGDSTPPVLPLSLTGQMEQESGNQPYDGATANHALLSSAPTLHRDFLVIVFLEAVHLRCVTCRPGERSWTANPKSIFLGPPVDDPGRRSFVPDDGGHALRRGYADNRYWAVLGVDPGPPGRVKVTQHGAAFPRACRHTIPSALVPSAGELLLVTWCHDRTANATSDLILRVFRFDRGDMGWKAVACGETTYAFESDELRYTAFAATMEVFMVTTSDGYAVLSSRYHSIYLWNHLTSQFLTNAADYLRRRQLVAPVPPSAPSSSSSPTPPSQASAPPSASPMEDLRLTLEGAEYPSLPRDVVLVRDFRRQHVLAVGRHRRSRGSRRGPLGGQRIHTR